MKKWLINFFLLLIFIFASIHPALAALTFDWNGSGTSWTNSSSWTETGGSGSYPGASGRTTDIVRFGVTGSSYTNQPTLTSSLTVASIEFGGGIEKTGTALTVNGCTLTVTGSITQDINTTSSSNTIFDYLQGSGTISCGSIFVGSGTNITGTFNFLLSDIWKLYVTGNVTIISNVNKPNGSGFRLEDGNMYLSGQILFTTLSNVTASNASYFTINTVAQAGGNTTPTLYLSNSNPVGTIPTTIASVNFYGDRGGTGAVVYTGDNPVIYTTTKAGFGTGGANIDTTKASYYNLTIQGTGTATIGGSVLGQLKIDGDFTTASPVTFTGTGILATNISIGSDWVNSSTVTGTAGVTSISNDLSNSGTFNFGSGAVSIHGDLTNTGTLNTSSGAVNVDQNVTNSGNLTLSSGNLTIVGDYTNSTGGVFTAGSGTVYFNNNSAESLIDNSTTGTTFNKVNFISGGTKTMSGTGSFAISGIGILTMGASTILNTGNMLTLISTSTSTATVAAIPSTSSIAGTVNAQRYISGGSNAYRGYRLLSSPVYTVKSGSNYYYDLSYLPSFAPITGTLGTAGGVTKAGNPSIYLYRDNVAFTNTTYNSGNFRGINKINNNPLYSIGLDYDGTFNLHVGSGFMFFYRGNLTNIATKYITSTSAEANVFSSTGTLNQQSVTVVNWYTGLNTLQCSVVPGNTGYSGYNLVGNPYASSIDWSTFSSSSSAAGIYGPNVGSTIYILNEVSKLYATYNLGLSTNGGSNIIPSGQGFFVKANTSSAQLTFNESAKTNSQLSGPTSSSGTTLLLANKPASMANSLPQYLRLQLYADAINNDETIIRFDNSSKYAFDINQDSQYFPGNGIISLSSSTTDSVAVAINVIPYPNKSHTIRLNVGATISGTYSLNLTQLQQVPALYDIWLEDKFKGDSVDLRANPTYSFIVDESNKATFGSNRFSLVIRQNAALQVSLVSFTGTKAPNSSAQVAWTTKNEANYTTFYVEKSTDNGKNFKVIDSLLSYGQGNYGYTDVGPDTSLNVYRLRMSDICGVVTYSNAVQLLYPIPGLGTTNNISVYPNPAVSTLSVAVVQKSDATASATTVPAYGIRIINSNGLLIKTATSSQPTWRDDVSSLAPGIYFIQVINNNDQSIIGKSKFVKL